MYMVSSQQRNTASWVGPKKQRPSRKDKNYQQKIELVQDLTFPTATSRIKVTPDGEFLIASGIYPPQIKVYELREFALKFERHFDSEIIDFQILDDDYSKLAFLCTDRSIYLHAKYGKHYSLRIPRMGRDMAYDCWSCDLLCAASSSDLYRINLEKGQFLSPLRTQSPGLNVVCRSKLHGLVACGGDDGAVECFDMRTKSSIGRINAVEHGGDINEEVTALKFDEDGGFTMAVGSSGGKVAAKKPNPTIFLKACELMKVNQKMLCMYGMFVGMIYGVQEMQDAMLGFGEVMSTPSRRCRSHGGSVCTFERVSLT